MKIRVVRNERTAQTGAEAPLRTAALYGRPLRNRQTEYGDSVCRLRHHAHLYFLCSRGSGAAGAVGSVLRADDLGHLPHTVPEHIQAV